MTQIGRRKRKSTETKIRWVKRARYQVMEAKPQIRKKANINDLPNELLVKIFSNLRRPNDLLRATLVNRNWNNLISNTRSVMQRIGKLYINERNLENIPNFTRNYETIHIDEVTEWNPELYKCLRIIARSVKRLVLFECIFFDEDFKSMLECFPNLEELEIYDCHPGISPLNNYTTDDRITLEKLNLLMLTGYSWPLRLICTPNLHNLNAESLTFYDQEWLIKFTNDQRHLEKLHLIDIIDLFDSGSGLLETNFELKQLVLYDIPHTDFMQLFRMLSRVKNSLVTLDIGFQTARVITEYALINLRNLTSLSIDCNCLPSSTRYYDFLSPNDTLKHVRIYGVLRNSKPLLKFLKRHPAIEVLNMKSTSNLHSTKFTFWNEFSSVTQNVCYLSVGHLEPYNMVYMKSTKLKHIDVDFIGYTNDSVWIDFCKNNPNIEFFLLFWKQKYFDQKVEELLFKNLPKLKQVFTKNSN